MWRYLECRYWMVAAGLPPTFRCTRIGKMAAAEFSEATASLTAAAARVKQQIRG